MKKISKKASIILWCGVSIIFAIIYTLVCVKLGFLRKSMALIKILCIFSIVEFIGLNIIIGLRKIWDFIIDNRYKIALICLLVLTILGLSGSSMGAITNWILEPELDNSILGIKRFIRSDEYAVEIPMNIFQKNNGFEHFQNINGINKTDMNISVHVPTKTLVSFFRIYNLGYFILSPRMAVSFEWNFKIIALLLITYEFMRIITNDKKYLSLIGTFIICFSSFINWWMGISIDIICFGELFVIAIYKFMQSKNNKQKSIWSFVFVYSVISYIMTLYPAWIISFGYVFFSLSIWIIIKNKKQYLFKKSDILYFVCIILSICLFGIYFYKSSFEAIHSILNSSYPGARVEFGGKGIVFLFSYLFSFLLPYVQNIDTMQLASFISIFPVPIIIGTMYLYKKEKYSEFLLPIIVVLVLESIWIMSGLPGFIAKITLLYMVPVERCANAVGLGSVYLIFFMIANIDEAFIKQKHACYITILIICILYFIKMPSAFSSMKMLYVFVIIESLLCFLLLNIGKSKYNNVFLASTLILTLISGISINPITIGINSITDTNFSKVVQNQVVNNPEGIWITEDIDMVVANYLVANGAKTLNVTQTYPNEIFWSKILENKKEEYREIWNRYAHIRIEIIEEGETFVELLSNDRIVLYLTPEKIKELDIKYIVSYKDLETIWKNGLSIKKIYEKKNNSSINIEGEVVSGIYIYEFVY